MDELIHVSIIKLISIIETTSSRRYSILNTYLPYYYTPYGLSCILTMFNHFPTPTSAHSFLTFNRIFAEN